MDQKRGSCPTLQWFKGRNCNGFGDMVAPLRNVMRQPYVGTLKRVVFLACIMNAHGCTSKAADSGSNAPPANPVSESEFRMQFATTLCDRLAACCAAEQSQFDSTNCLLRETPAAEISESFDAQAAGTCLQELQQLECRATGLPPSCNVICGENATCPGATTPGEPCQTNADCTPEQVCPDTGPCRQRPGIGEACSIEIDWCVYGTYCRGACAPKKAVGQPCTVSRECLGFCVDGTCAGPTPTPPRGGVLSLFCQ